MTRNLGQKKSEQRNAKHGYSHLQSSGFRKFPHEPGAAGPKWQVLQGFGFFWDTFLRNWKIWYRHRTATLARKRILFPRLPKDDRIVGRKNKSLCWFVFSCFWQNTGNRLLASSCLSIHPSSWRNSAPTRRIFMKFDISEFF